MALPSEYKMHDGSIVFRTYRVTFTVPSTITFTGAVDEGASASGQSTSVVFTLVAANRGGGGSGHHGGA